MKLRSGIPRKIRSALIAFLALGGLCCFGAQSYQPVYGDPMIEPWRWRTFSDLRGLDAQCVIEAKDGTIWFGTDDGLSCYDGMEWTRHLADDGVIAGRVAAMSNQADGALNAGGWWGISRFSQGKWNRLIPASGIRFADVRRLASAPDGSLWAATSWGALVQRGSTWTLYTDEATAAPLRQDSRYANLIIELLPETILSRAREGAPPGSRIDLTEVSADLQGRIWFGTKGGEIICHTPAGTDPAATPAHWTLYNESDGLVGGRIPAILPLQDGTVWVVRALPIRRACSMAAHGGPSPSPLRASLPTARDFSKPGTARSGFQRVIYSSHIGTDVGGRMRNPRCRFPLRSTSSPKRKMERCGSSGQTRISNAWTTRPRAGPLWRI